jgi:RNA polymerase sigma-70 factor, ECF subfamily
MSDSAQAATSLPPALESIAPDLYQRSKGERFGLTQQQFIVIVWEVAQKYLPPTAAASEATEFYANLRVEELALARACACGNEVAWETFLIRYREKLYEIALHIAREDSAARELADSLYADLYGLNSRQPTRVSKLASYTGRGSLEGWLRTVLAQEHVNRYRKQKRFVSMEEEAESGAQFAAPEPPPAVVADPRLESATDDALAALSPEDRFVLSAYYLDGRTLAEIGRMIGTHESTISRKLVKVSKALRKQILAGLSRRGMSRRQAKESLEVDVRDLRVDIRSRLTQETAPPPFPEKKVRTEAGDGSTVT